MADQTAPKVSQLNTARDLLCGMESHINVIVSLAGAMSRTAQATNDPDISKALDETARLIERASRGIEFNRAQVLNIISAEEARIDQPA